MEGGLHHPTLAQVKVSFTGKQSFPKDSLDSLKAGVLHKIPGLCHQDALDLIRVADQENISLTNLKMQQISITRGRFIKKLQRVTGKRE